MSKLTPHHHHPHHHQSDHPIPYEVAGGHNIPPTSYTPISKGQGPPVFYAPSPDVELAQKKKQLEQQKQQEHSQPEFNPVHVEIDDHEDEDSLPHPNFKRENSNLVQPSSSKRKTVTTLRQKHVKKDEGSKKPPPLPPTKNRPEMTNDNDTSKPRTRGRQRRQSDAPDDTTKAKQNPEGRGYPNDDDDLADNSNIPEVQPYPVEDDDNSNQQHHRTRRSTRNDDDDDMLADGLDNIESLWQPAPPPPQQQQQASSSPSSSASYIRFDRYKKHGEESVEQRSPNSPTSSNVSFHDSNSEEQRFFPSFPSPYLTGLSPFGLSNALSASPITGGIGGSGIGRAPLFPGPSSNNNRAPSRYHPSSNAPFKFGGISSPLSNRGPSSAASHGHDRYREHDNNLLGSGNFEVIRGGTYYGEDDEGPSYHHHGHHQAASPYRDEDDGYYSQNNGHSSPYHMGGGGGDFFANFRDFADINPHSRSYSHQTETRVEHVGRTPSADRRTSVRDELLQTASSQHNNNKPQFSLEYDPMMATF
ncbi:uncharacterized protein LOC110856892 isoform X4 [Folsomia candida]|uniref:uncharacterized protein LOC110856892 isoform X4 n=1 Tax=Folsomia candida TaxID=158441 RepID=UPI00160509B8|nr:uncharacterized protein LOC110856892 isoform X4 [Folsomia candida]